MNNLQQNLFINCNHKIKQLRYHTLKTNTVSVDFNNFFGLSKINLTIFFKSDYILFP